jgi:hypothetical protein
MLTCLQMLVITTYLEVFQQLVHRKARQPPLDRVSRHR